MKYVAFSIVFSLLLFFPPHISNATMTGGGFEIYADNFSVIQDQVSSVGSFTLYSTGGEGGAATTTVGALALRGGFLALEKASLSLSVNKGNVSFGILSTLSVKTADITLRVTTDSATGYTVSASEDQELCRGVAAVCENDIQNINGVSDGTVTAGSEEYGIATSGGSGILSSDTAIEGSVAVASASGEVTNEETMVTFKASVGQNSRAGDYTHVVTFTGTANP